MDVSPERDRGRLRFLNDRDTYLPGGEFDPHGMIEFWRGAGIHIDFDKRATWPDVVPPGWDGPVQHTVWLLLKIDGRWYGSGVMECWRDRQSTDDTDVTENNQIARNWLYDGRWGPMQGHRGLVQGVYLLQIGAELVRHFRMACD